MQTIEACSIKKKEGQVQQPILASILALWNVNHPQNHIYFLKKEARQNKVSLR
jgi:hypothetical protein